MSVHEITKLNIATDDGPEQGNYESADISLKARAIEWLPANRHLIREGLRGLLNRIGSGERMKSTATSAKSDSVRLQGRQE